MSPNSLEFPDGERHAAPGMADNKRTRSLAQAQSLR
jgi:hypothetical protein